MSTADIADSINEATADPVPEIPIPLSDSVPLLRGLAQETDEGTIWHNVAVVKELTGVDEEYLAALQRRSPSMPYTEYTNHLLERAVTRIGDIPATKEVIAKLILADRDMLYLAILKATYGKTKEFRAMCAGEGGCGAWNDIEIDLDEDFPITEPDFDIRQPISVECSKGKTYQLRMPNGEDVLAVQKHSDNQAEYNTQMIARCAVFPEGEPKDNDGDPIDKVDWARNLSVADRRKLVNTLLEIDLGPHLEVVDTQCSECAVNMPILLDWVSLLLS